MESAKNLSKRCSKLAQLLLVALSLVSSNARDFVPTSKKSMHVVAVRRPLGDGCNRAFSNAIVQLLNALLFVATNILQACQKGDTITRIDTREVLLGRLIGDRLRLSACSGLNRAGTGIL
jgi:hypothetical protein